MRIKTSAETHKRVVTREKNEQGHFERLARELEEIGKQYGIDIDDITEMYAEVNCSKPNLRKLIEG